MDFSVSLNNDTHLPQIYKKKYFALLCLGNPLISSIFGVGCPVTRPVGWDINWNSGFRRHSAEKWRLFLQREDKKASLQNPFFKTSSNEDIVCT